jgi:hypothetical protein
VSRPRADEPSPDEARELVSRLAFLDGDWDGRVFTDPGGTVSTRSAVHRDDGHEYPADVVEARETPGGLWLRVRLFSGNPCEDPDVPVAHEGWIPAYSERGALVVGTWPGGC